MEARSRARAYSAAIIVLGLFYASLQYNRKSEDFSSDHRIKIPVRIDENATRIVVSSGTVEILFWTEYYQTNIVNILPSETLTSDKNHERTLHCPNSKIICKFTKSHEHVDSADAVVFHARNIFRLIQKKKLLFPESRKEKQPWVLFHRESPIHTLLDLKAFPDVFNWTMTYRKDSDVPFPYGKVIKGKSRNEVPSEIKVDFVNKNRSIAWTVSNCKTESKRNELVNMLKEHISVDIYGRCGDHKCPDGNLNDGCHEYLEKFYKFYLSFENSLCDEYVTEKLFNALKSQMIPVVYGLADYASIAPPKSYINVRDYKSVKELADHLLFLEANQDEYAKYFEWKKDWEVVETDLTAWCALCEKVVHERASGWKRRKWYNDINQWYSNAVPHEVSYSEMLRSSNGFVQQVFENTEEGGHQKNLRSACMMPEKSYPKLFNSTKN